MQHHLDEQTASQTRHGPDRHLPIGAAPAPRVSLCAEGPAFLAEQIATRYRDELQTRKLRALRLS